MVMYNNFLCYTRSEVVNNNTLLDIKSKYKNLYCDYYDNIYCHYKEGKRVFSNESIGFCLEKLLKSDSLVLYDAGESLSLFSQLELLIEKSLNKKIYLLKDIVEGNRTLCECKDVDVYLDNILNCKNLNSSMFLAYTRNNHDYIFLLEKFRKRVSQELYIDCLDNLNVRDNKMNYSAYNKKCDYSTSIFDEVFNNLIMCKSFCFIASENIYANNFVRLQYMVARILKKNIYYISEKDFFDIINGNILFDCVCKKADLLFYDIKFSV